MIIDAEGHILGRLSSFIAKQALMGENVIVVNAEKAVVSGKKEAVFKKYLKRLEWKNKMNYRKGPFHQKRPDKFVRKAIRGMLPFERLRGRDAYKKIMVYTGIPENEIMRVHNLNVNKEGMYNSENIRKSAIGVTVADICKFIGGKKQ